jgi:hypothetical protein
VVFTLPAAIGAIAYQNKAKVYGLLFTAAAEALTTIAADPKHLGAEIGVTAVLHTWGQNLDHHPHVHCIVPGGGVSPDGGRWMQCRPGFFLPVRVLSRLFRGLFIAGLRAMHAAGELQFFGEHAALANPAAFAGYLAPLRKCEWVAYAKRPFAGPDQVLAYLARYTHRVAIGNSRLVEHDDTHVSFRWKDYRANGRDKNKVMRLGVGEFIGRFLLHVLPNGFTVSATTACSPMDIVPRSLPSVDSCSKCRLARPAPAIIAAKPVLPIMSGRVVHAAADAWRSSKPSTARCLDHTASGGWMGCDYSPLDLTHRDGNFRYRARGRASLARIRMFKRSPRHQEPEHRSFDPVRLQHPPCCAPWRPPQLGQSRLIPTTFRAKSP